MRVSTVFDKRWKNTPLICYSVLKTCILITRCWDLNVFVMKYDVSIDSLCYPYFNVVDI